MNLIHSNNFSNTVIVYHGSDKLNGSPIYGKGKTDCDYGLGFYCTEDSEMGKLWSVTKDTDGILNKYELNLVNLKILDLDEEHVLSWLAILMKYRIPENLSDFQDELRNKFISKFQVYNIEDYDVIKGYRADDSYFQVVTSFLRGELYVEDLKEALHLGNLGKQIVLKSSKSFERLEFIESETVSSKDYFKKYSDNDRRARNLFKDLKAKSLYKKGTTIRDLIMKEI